MQETNLQPSDAAEAAKRTVTQPKLSDVTRLLYSTILDGSVGDEVKPAISHLLREVVASSRMSSVMPPLLAEATSISKPSASLSIAASDRTEELNQENGKHVKAEQERNTLNVGSVEVEETTTVTTKVKAIKPEATAASAPPWKCPRCSFMNLDMKHRCIECSRRRPQQTYQSETGQNNDEASLVSNVLVKVPVDERPAKKALKRKDSVPSPSTQVRNNMKDRLSSLANQEEDSMDLEDSPTEAEVSSDGSEAFHVLDDILEYEDSDDDVQEGKQIARSVDSEGDEEGKVKRPALSELFPKLDFPESRRDKQCRSKPRNERRNCDRFPNGRRFCNDDGIQRSKFGFLGFDDQEVSENDDTPHKSRRGFGSQDDKHTQRCGNRGGRNSSTGRGSRDNGGGGGRGDSFEGQHESGGPRGDSAYRSRGGGGRSSSFGIRSPRGMSAF